MKRLFVAVLALLVLSGCSEGGMFDQVGEEVEVVATEVAIVALTPTNPPTETPVPTETFTPRPTNTSIPTLSVEQVVQATLSAAQRIEEEETQEAVLALTPTETPIPTNTPTETPLSAEEYQKKIQDAMATATAEAEPLGVGETYHVKLEKDSYSRASADPNVWLVEGGVYRIIASGQWQEDRWPATGEWYGPEGKETDSYCEVSRLGVLMVQIGRKSLSQEPVFHEVGKEIEITSDYRTRPFFKQVGCKLAFAYEVADTNIKVTITRIDGEEETSQTQVKEEATETPTAKPASASTLQEGEAVAVEVFADKKWQDTGIAINAGEGYRVAHGRGTWNLGDEHIDVWGAGVQPGDSRPLTLVDGLIRDGHNGGVYVAIFQGDDPVWMEHIAEQYKDYYPEVSGTMALAINDSEDSYANNSGSVLMGIMRVR